MDYINVGLVGHVANGKTTLVQRLSGVNTKKNSQEIKSGKTIKLGYANCIIWHCLICDAIYTTGQTENINCCSNSNIEKFKISFIDAPGHHSYVHTMIKGTSVMDCAIVMSDVRAKEIQPQTMEHLLILDILGIKDMIVLQNKIDLVSLEECKSNYEMLKEKLPNCPILPISAQMGIGMEMFKRKLFEMVKYVKLNGNKPNMNFNVLSIIRSFDINKPGSDGSLGGVIGGTCLASNDFRVGDSVYILPGKVQTVIKSIHSESLECKEMYRGGLYGIGTDLKGEMTKADNLVGYVMVKNPESVQVANSIKINLCRLQKFLDNTPTPKIEMGGTYQVMIGNAVVKGIVSEKIDKLYNILFAHPICIVGNTCILYTMDSKLYAYGYLNNIVEEKDEKHPTEFNLNDYLQTLFQQSSERKKQSLPAPSLFRENRNIVWTNMQIFCQSIKREPENVSTFVKEELCIDASLCREGLRIFKSNINTSKFQVILRKYVKENVSCGQCKSVDTILRRNSARGQEIVCNKCGSIKNIT